MGVCVGGRGIKGEGAVKGGEGVLGDEAWFGCEVRLARGWEGREVRSVVERASCKDVQV